MENINLKLSNKSTVKENWDPKEAISTLDYLCSEIADRYDLFSKGCPRKATIVEVLARNSCIGCIDKQFQSKSYQRIDNIYSELHQLACSLLVEELYDQLVKKGHSVTITTEENIRYGKVDVFIVPTHFGLNLHSKKKEIAVEIKTGFSLSITQLLRYMIDNEHRWLVLWRIRNQQILLFCGYEIRELLAQFTKMVISRAERLLSTPELTCKHNSERNNWVPNQNQLKETFSDFTTGIVKTLPEVVETVVTTLEMEVNENAKR